MKELIEYYTLEEAYDIYECIAVAKYNEHLALKHAQRKNGKR
jgi:hypothetical protein